MEKERNMKLKSKLLSPVMRRFAHASGLSAVLARHQGMPRILMLHAVGTKEQAAVYPFLFNLFPTHVFESEMRYLARNFTVVPLGWILDKWQTGKLINSRHIALTFDDGLRNNVTMGYP